MTQNRFRWLPALPAGVPAAAVPVGIAAMAVTVALANLAVLHPINDWLTWGHFVFPVAFLVTDLCNRLFGREAAERVVAGGFAVAVAASLLLAGPRIALASGTAFLVGQLVDIRIFDYLRRASWWQAPVVSSLVAGTVDTALFYSLAFAGSGAPWEQWAGTDLAVKMLMILPLLGPFRLLSRRLAGRSRQRASEPPPGG